MVIQAEAEPQWRLVTGLSWCQCPISALLATAWPPPVPLVCRHVQRRRSSSSTSQRSAPYGRCVPPGAAALHRYSLPPYQPLPAIASTYPLQVRQAQRRRSPSFALCFRIGAQLHQWLHRLQACPSLRRYELRPPRMHTRLLQVRPTCLYCSPLSSAAEGRVLTITVNALATSHTGALSSILAAHQAPKPYRTCRSAQRQQRPGTRCERQATYRG